MARYRLETKDGKTRVFDRYSNTEIPDVVKVEFVHSVDDGANPQLLITIRDFAPEIAAITGGPAPVREITKLGDTCRSYKAETKVKFREFT